MGKPRSAGLGGTCPRPPLHTGTGTGHTRLDFLSTVHRRSDPVFHDEDICVDDILSDTVSDDRVVKQPSVKWAGAGDTQCFGLRM